MDSIEDLGHLSRAKGFKMVHMNVRSLPKEVKILLLDSKIDVVTMSETWLNAAVNSATIQLKGYVEHRLDRVVGRKGKKRGGGLLTYIKDEFASESEALPDISTSCLDIEAQWTILHRTHCKDVVICNVYRPPGGKLDKAVKYLNECLSCFDLSKVDIFILGDMNVDYKKKTSPIFKNLKFFVQSNGLTQVISNTTRNTNKGSSLLDVIITNSKYVSSSGTLNHFFSDRQPIFLVKKKKRDKRPHTEFRGRSYKNYDREAFKASLLGMDWRELYNLTDPELVWECILGRFAPLLDKMCPIRSFKIKNYRPEWITPELIEQIKDRDYFYLKAKTEGDEDSWNIAKHLRNVTNANIRQAKREFVLEELDKCNHDSKKFWHTIRSVVPNNKGSSRQDILLKNEGKKLERSEVAHFINDFFINVGKVESTEEPNVSDNARSRAGMEVDREEGGWVAEDFTVEEVLKLVKEINVSKSSGMQDISSFIIKEVFTILASQVTYMMNISIKSGIFPSAWKKGLVIPIPKGGNQSQVQNYRPISLLPLPGKIAEKLVHKQLMVYIEDGSIIDESQHGFRRGHSCIHSIAQLTDYVSKKMDAGLPTIAAFVDFRKAFDCVQHPILLEKLGQLGVHQSMIKWFRSYLSGRKQRVLANDVYSSYLDVLQGVPQGSVLGPPYLYHCKALQNGALCR